jgi:hypothetical protein
MVFSVMVLGDINDIARIIRSPRLTDWMTSQIFSTAHLMIPGSAGVPV